MDYGLDWTETQAVERRGTPCRQRETVLRRPVAFVFIEGVLGSQPMIEAHEAIAGHLRDNRGAGDDAAHRIPMDDRPARNRQARWCGSINQDELRLNRQIADGTSHRQQRRLQDVVLIDFRCAGETHPDMGLLEDEVEGALSLEGCQPLGIIDADGKSRSTQDNGRRHHRSRPRPSPGLIHTGDEPESRGARGGFRKPATVRRRAVPLRRRLQPMER